MQHGCNARRPLAYSGRCDRRNHRQFGLQQQAVGAAVTNETTVGCTANGAQAKLLRHGVAHLRHAAARHHDGNTHLRRFDNHLAGQPPAIAGKDHDLHELAEDIHESLFWAITTLVVLHAAAAFYHHLFQRDATLLRMLPGGQRRVEQPPETPDA